MYKSFSFVGGTELCSLIFHYIARKRSWIDWLIDWLIDWISRRANDGRKCERNTCLHFGWSGNRSNNNDGTIAVVKNNMNDIKTKRLWHFHKKSKINRQSIRLIQRNGDSKHLNFTPLFGLLLNAAFSTIYGLVINNQTLILVNSIMFCLSLYYVVVYYSFAIEPRQKVTPSIFFFSLKIIFRQINQSRNQLKYIYLLEESCLLL